MDAAAPTCPSCSSPVQPDWDWCQLCGYDPDELMPMGWIPPQLYKSGGTTITEAPPKRRRARRKKAAADPGPPPPLIELPGNLAPAIDPITEDGGRSIVADSPTPATASPTPAAPMADHPERPHDPVALEVPTTIEPIRPPVVAPTPSKRGTPVFRVRATPPELIGAGVLLVASAGLAYLTVRGILQVATGASTTVLDNVTTVVFVVICAVVAFAAAVQGLALVRQRVELQPTELVAHNRFGRVQKVSYEEVYAIRLSQRQFATPRGLSQAIETPYVQRSDGSGFWLDALGGRSPGASPSDEQLALFDQLTEAVAHRRPPRPPLT